MEQTASLKLISFIMNNNKSARGECSKAPRARLQPLWHGKTHFHSPPASERDKKRFTACKSKGEGPRQHQKISVRMCDQIELITLTCKRGREMERKRRLGMEVGGRTRSPQRYNWRPNWIGPLFFFKALAPTAAARFIERQRRRGKLLLWLQAKRLTRIR